MATAPGADFLETPLPNTAKARTKPTQYAPFASIKNSTDFPASAACCMPSGTRMPWLIALFKNKICAGSTKNGVSSSRLCAVRKFTPADSTCVRAVIAGATPAYPSIHSATPSKPSEKLSTSISRPGLIFPSAARSNRLSSHAASGPIIMPPTSITTSEPTTVPIVANAPMTPPRLPCTLLPAV